MPLDWNKDKDKDSNTYVFLTQVVEPQLKVVKEMTIDIALIKASVQQLKDDQSKMNRYVLEGNGRPSLTERTNLLEERVKAIDQVLCETEVRLNLLPDRVSEIKEQVENITVNHEGQSNRTKWISGTIVSLVLVLIPLLWNSTPFVIKWIELQKYTMQVYDQHLQEIKDLKNKK